MAQFLTHRSRQWEISHTRVLPNERKNRDKEEILHANVELLRWHIKERTAIQCHGNGNNCWHADGKCHTTVKWIINARIPDTRISEFTTPGGILNVVKCAVNACMGEKHLQK